jgi:hypothetical protein
MNDVLMALAAAALLAAAVYAQLRVSRYTAGTAKITFIRAVLLVVGIAFGYVAARPYGAELGPRVLAFLIGFGAVHFPAAFILFVKGRRGSGKS